MIAINMNIPENCRECPFCIEDMNFDLVFCAASNYVQWHKIKDKDIYSKQKHFGCPLIEVTKCVDCKFGAADTEAHWFCLDLNK